ncbi:MAG: PqqD family protein [Euryarchaeota archaeon]|nr:PqqD family protein [Euryarchaeota archaeon]
MPNPPKSSTKNISAEDQERLMVLARSLQSYRANLQYVDYKQAEKDSEKLAVKILEVYHRKELESFSFKAIPRGGLIVMGMLSYILDLKPSQFLPNENPAKPVMIVDDIALTGARLSKMLSGINSSHVVIANLYSHPDLRMALMEKEPRVKHCFAAHDLRDRARENHPDPQEYEAWKKRMIDWMGGNRYWVCQPDLVGFAWNEPDYPFWNPVTECLEDGWRSLPPHKCLKNKTRLGILPHQELKVELQMSSSVVSGIFDDVIWLYQADTKQVYTLEGVSAQIWSVLVVYGNIESTVKYLTGQYTVKENILRRDVHGLVDYLLAKGILERAKEKPSEVADH